MYIWVRRMPWVAEALDPLELGFQAVELPDMGARN